ncbi:MAG TPA: hypothetical protein VMP00_03025, partial [Burkholderiales bacterium]|nr:hypothetical protein [Burkholderiales bacterium]
RIRFALLAAILKCSTARNPIVKRNHFGRGAADICMEDNGEHSRGHDPLSLCKTAWRELPRFLTPQLPG